MLEPKINKNKKDILLMILNHLGIDVKSDANKAEIVEVVQQEFEGDEFTVHDLDTLAGLFEISDLEYFEGTHEHQTFDYVGDGLGVPGLPNQVKMYMVRRFGDFALMNLRAALENGNYEYGPIVEPEGD